MRCRETRAPERVSVHIRHAPTGMAADLHQEQTRH